MPYYNPDFAPRLNPDVFSPAMRVAAGEQIPADEQAELDQASWRSQYSADAALSLEAMRHTRVKNRFQELNRRRVRGDK